MALSSSRSTPSLDEDLAMLLKAHQPIGQGEVVDVEDDALVAEGGAIFAVRIKHDDMGVGRLFDDAVQDQRRRRRLARAGRTEDGEMLAKQRINVERCTDIGRSDTPSRSRPSAGGGCRTSSTRSSWLTATTGSPVRGKRVTPRRKLRQAAIGRFVAFAKEIDAGAHGAASIGCPRLPVSPTLPSSHCAADLYLDLAADAARQGQHRVRVPSHGFKGAAIKADDGSLEGDRLDLADDMLLAHDCPASLP